MNVFFEFLVCLIIFNMSILFILRKFDLWVERIKNLKYRCSLLILYIKQNKLKGIFFTPLSYLTNLNSVTLFIIGFVGFLVLLSYSISNYVEQV